MGIHFKTIIMRTINHDALIIGSGFGAAPPAMRLAKAGLNVGILEKGPSVNPYQDFKKTQDPKYLLKYLKSLHSKNLTFSYVEAEGGGSGFYVHISLRAPSFVFKQTDVNGRPLWPGGIDRKKMDPYYQLGEDELHVSQIGVKKIPKSGQVFAGMMKNLDYSVDRSRYAEINCRNCGWCVTGCIYGAKQCLMMNYLASAKEKDALMYTDTEAVAIRKSHSNTNSHHRYEVYAKSQKSGNHWIRFRSKFLILGGGTFGTAKLLLKSKSKLPKLSNQLGKNLSFNGSVKHISLLPNWCPDADMFTGRTNPGTVSYEFLESDHFLITVGKAMPLSLFGLARISKQNPEDSSFWGKSHVELMRLLRKRMMILVAQGLTPPECEVKLKKGKLIFIDGPISNLRRFYDQGKNLLENIVLKNGGTPLKLEFLDKKGVPYKDVHFSSSHPLGSCRMADTPETGVADSKGQIFGYPGMYVTDGASIPSGLIVNPSLTILANAERITQEILKNA
jgi:choline dehydrogenase-like flavoprotein